MNAFALSGSVVSMTDLETWFMEFIEEDLLEDPETFNLIAKENMSEVSKIVMNYCWNLLQDIADLKA
jgi:hypothetical protein